MEEDLKSLARTLVAAANAMAAIAAAVYFIAEWFYNVGGDGGAGTIRPLFRPGLLAVLGAVVLVLNLLRVLYFRAGKRRDVDGPLLSHTSDGVVHVSREAVESGLRAVGEALDDVTRLRVKVLTPARRKTLVRAHYLAREGVQPLELSSRLRRSLVERFHELVAIEKDAKLEIEMIFEGFYGKVKSKAPDAEPEPDEPEEAEVRPPFTGPRYPIDVEGESV